MRSIQSRTTNFSLSANKKQLNIRPETHCDYKDIVSLVLRSFREGTEYSDGTDIVALIEEIRDSDYYIPELSFVAELDGEIVGHFPPYPEHKKAGS